MAMQIPLDLSLPKPSHKPEASRSPGWRTGSRSSAGCSILPRLMLLQPRAPGPVRAAESDGRRFGMTEDERLEFRRRIRNVLDKAPPVKVISDPEARKRKLMELVKKYELVVQEEDPDWPEEDEGWGFNWGQFFDKITIKNVRPDDDDGYDSGDEIVWKDDDYIRPIDNLTGDQWEETVFKDMDPLVILVHNRYSRPKQNEKARDHLEKAVHIFWASGLPSPRCFAVDAVVDPDLVDALKVTRFPEVLFTTCGKILHRDKVVREPEEWSRMMTFFYFNALRPEFLPESVGLHQEKLPSYVPKPEDETEDELEKES